MAIVVHRQSIRVGSMDDLPPVFSDLWMNTYSHTERIGLLDACFASGTLPLKSSVRCPALRRMDCLLRDSHAQPR